MDRGSNTGQVPTVDWATPSIRDAISPRPKSTTSATSRSWFAGCVPLRKNARALQRTVPAGFGPTRLLRSGAGAAKGEPGNVQHGQTPGRDDEGAGLPALGIEPSWFTTLPPSCTFPISGLTREVELLAELRVRTRPLVGQIVRRRLRLAHFSFVLGSRFA